MRSPAKSTIERALELAHSEQCRCIEDIKQMLSRERYDAVETHLSGTSIKAQLRAAITASTG